MSAELTEDDAMDSGQEDYDTEELKLQDIAAIVLGDVRQVCINAVTSDSENESFSAHCYGSSDVSKIDNESDIGVLHDDNIDYKKDITVLNLPEESKERKELVNGICEKTSEISDIDGDKSDIDLHISDLDSNVDSIEGGTPVVTNSASSTSSIDRSPRKPTSPVTSLVEVDNHENKDIRVSRESIEFTIAETESTLRKLHVDNERSPSAMLCDEKSESNFTPISNNYQLCCDRENLQKLLECDNSNDEFPSTKEDIKPNETPTRHEMVTNTEDCPLECNEFKDALQESNEICEQLTADLQRVQFSHSNDSSISVDGQCFMNIDIPLPPDDPPPMDKSKDVEHLKSVPVNQNEHENSPLLDKSLRVDRHERKNSQFTEKSSADRNERKSEKIESFHERPSLKNERRKRSENRKESVGKKSNKKSLVTVEPAEVKRKSRGKKSVTDKSPKRRSNSKKSPTRSPEDIGRNENKKRRKSRSKKEKSPNENRSPQDFRYEDVRKTESNESSKHDNRLLVKEREKNRRSRKPQSPQHNREKIAKSKSRKARSRDRSSTARKPRDFKSQQKRSSDESADIRLQNEIRSPLRCYDGEKLNEFTPRYEQSSDRSFRTADRSPADFTGGDCRRRDESFLEYERERSWERSFANAGRSPKNFVRCESRELGREPSPTDIRRQSPEHDSFHESVPERSDADFITVDQLPEDYKTDDRSERDSFHDSVKSSENFITVDQLTDDHPQNCNDSVPEPDGKFVTVDQVPEDYKTDDRSERDDSFHESIPEPDGKFVTVDQLPEDYKMDDRTERDDSFHKSVPEPDGKFVTVDQLPEDCRERENSFQESVHEPSDGNFVTVDQLPNRREHDDSFHSRREQSCERNPSPPDSRRDRSRNDRSCDKNTKIEHRSPENYRRGNSSRKSRHGRSRDRTPEDYHRDKSRNRNRRSRDRSYKSDRRSPDDYHDDRHTRSSRHERSSDRSFKNPSPEEYKRNERRKYRESSRSSRHERSSDRSFKEGEDYRHDERNKHSVSSHSSRNERSSDRSSRNEDRSPDDRKRNYRSSDTFRKDRSPDDRKRRSESCRSRKSVDTRHHNTGTHRRSDYDRYRYSSDRRVKSYRDEKSNKSSRRRSCSSNASSDGSCTRRDRDPNENENRARGKRPEPKSDLVRNVEEMLKALADQNWDQRPPEPREPDYLRPPEPKSPPPPEPDDIDIAEPIESKSDQVRNVEDMLKSLADENWDEEQPPEPELPPSPQIEYAETDYKPPEPNYPPPDDDDRPPSPIDDSTEAPTFQQILENEYRTERSVSKDAERMICDCVLTKEEIFRGEKGCGDDCLNRLLLIECCSRCSLAERCTNKRFQRREYPKCEVYRTKKKGHGLRILEDVPSGTFIMEYVGEVLNSYEFERRAMEYAKGKNPHFYFMSLKSDCIIDATVKGNISRFINHSCEPNAETQKWTVQGELRIGFFSMRDIKAGEEVTFDYQLQRYGKQAQRCYCDTPSCSGWIGGDPEKIVESKRGLKKRRDEYLDWETTLDEISQVGLMNRHQTLSLNRLMVHAKELPVRMQILQLIEEGNPPCRRLFVDYQGLPIIWSWMVDCTPEQDELKIQLLKTLAALPITNKTILVDSKVLSVVEQWAFMVEQKTQSSEALSAQSVLESVEDIASADETPVSELAQKVLNDWSSLRDAYRIPKKERIQQMKKHEQEADQNVVKSRTKRLPMYAEQMRVRNLRNRQHKDKDFDKIYYDRMNDYDNGNSTENRKRKESPDRRNFDRKQHRRSDYNKDGANNRFSKQEHRFMFEMKVARENERKREEEEQQQQWLKAFYSQTQPPIPGLMLPPQYLTSIPPPNYPTADPKATVSRTHPYYATVPPPAVYPALLPPPGTPQLTSHAQNTTTVVPPVNAASPYYRNAIAYPPQTPTPVAYPARPAPVAEQPQRKQAETDFPFDYKTVKNQLQQIATLDEIPVPVQSAEKPAEPNKKPEFNFASVNAADVDSTALKLPPKWRTAKDQEGRTYFYHTKTRVSQWYPPAWESRNDDDSSAGEDGNDVEFKKKRRKSEEKVEFDMDAEIKENLAAMSSEFQDSDYEDYSPILKTDEPQENGPEKCTTKQETPNETVPLITEHIISPREPIDPEERRKNKKRIRHLKEKLRRHKKQKLMNGGNHTSRASNGHHGGEKLVSAPADTSSITERKKKDAFRSHMANFVVNCLNPYFRSSCTQARITNYSDFKHLARKLTHFVMLKELKHCQSVTDLTCNSSVKHKAKEYIRKYMSKFGEVYERPPDDQNY